MRDRTTEMQMRTAAQKSTKGRKSAEPVRVKGFFRLHIVENGKVVGEMMALEQINSELCGVIDDMEREKRVLELERDRLAKRRSRERSFWYTFWLIWLFLCIVFML